MTFHKYDQQLKKVKQFLKINTDLLLWFIFDHTN